MSIEVCAYAQEHESEWEAFCANAVNATFLHTRRFLSYHGDRLKDASLLLKDDGKLVGVFSAAEAPSEPGLVVSHPGATYGGIVDQGRLRGIRMIEALTAIKDYYQGLGYQRLLYKPVPFIYTLSCAQDDLYALFRLGATRVRCDLSSAVNFAHRLAPSERRKRGLKKALKAVTLSNDTALLPALWGVLADNLARKHDAKPVHSLAELTMLQERFAQNIVLRCALIDGKVEAGIVFFNSATVWHAQYIAASSAAYDVSALDAVFDSAMLDAHAAGARYFDFGTSNESGGQVLNEGLYGFKSEFGGGGVAHEYYELPLGS